MRRGGGDIPSRLSWKRRQVSSTDRYTDGRKGMSKIHKYFICEKDSRNPLFESPSTFCLPFIFPPNYNVDDNTRSKNEPLDRKPGGQFKFDTPEFDKLEEKIKALAAANKPRSKRVITELINELVTEKFASDPLKRVKLNQQGGLDPKTMTSIRKKISASFKARK